MPRKKAKPLEAIVDYFLDAPYPEAEAAFVVLTVIMANRAQREAPIKTAAQTARSHKRKTTAPAGTDTPLPGMQAKVGD